MSPANLFERRKSHYNLRNTYCNLVQPSYNNRFYYINTNEIPGELSPENMILSHVKITRYLHT